MAKETKFIRQQAAELQRKIERDTLAKFRRRLRELSERRRAALKRARALCRASRVRFRERRKQIRAEHRQAAKLQIERERSAIRSACDARKRAVSEASRTESARARRRLAEERRMQRELKALARRTQKQQRATARERRQESDQEVEDNVAPELIGVWRAVAKSAKFRNPARKSRTEAFLEWAEENPEEVVALQAEHGEALTERDLAELREIEKKLMRRRPGKRFSKAELAALRRIGVEPTLADVPF